MNLSEVIDLTDAYYIAEHKAELNMKYKSVSNIIFTDGSYKHHVDKHAFIIIENLIDANYIVLVDDHDRVFLGVYKHCSQALYRDIVDSIYDIREQLGINKKDTEQQEEKLKDPSISEEDTPLIDVKHHKHEGLDNPDDGLISLSDLKCDHCGSTEFDEGTIATDVFALRYKCKQCGTVFTLVPVKYSIYSKTIIVNKENEPYSLN